MFGDRNENDPTDQTADAAAEDDLFDEDPLFDAADELDDSVQRLPWEELGEETADELEDDVDDRLCDHDEHKEVVPNQQGAGATIAGSGLQSTTTVNKIVCTKCAQEWETRDGDQQSSRRDPFGV